MYALLYSLALLGLMSNCQNSFDDETLLYRSWRKAERCGPNTAYIFLSVLGVDVEYRDAVEKLMGDRAGTSIGEMVEFIRESGIEVDAAKLKPNDLADEKFPLIAFLEPLGGIDASLGHFVVVYSVSGSEVSYVDGTSASLITRNIDEFIKGWGGLAIKQRGRSFFRIHWLLISLGGLMVVFSLLSTSRKSKSIKFLVLVVLLLGFPSIGSATQEASSAKVVSWQAKLFDLVKARNHILSSGRAVYEKTELDENGDDGPSIQKVEFSWDGNYRYIKETSIGDAGVIVCQREFDGTTFKSQIGNIYEVMDLEAMRNVPCYRFASVFLDFAGIYVPDPTLQNEMGAERFEYSWEKLLECNISEPESTTNASNSFQVKPQIDVPNSDVVSVFFRASSFDSLPTKISRVYKDTKLSEFEFQDIRQTELGVKVPHRIVFRGYTDPSYRGFNLRLIEFTSFSKPLSFKIEISSADSVVHDGRDSYAKLNKNSTGYANEQELLDAINLVTANGLDFHLDTTRNRNLALAAVFVSVVFMLVFYCRRIK